MKVRMCAFSSFTDKTCHSVDGKQTTGHNVLRVVVGELEEELFHVFKEMTINRY